MSVCQGFFMSKSRLSLPGGSERFGGTCLGNSEEQRRRNLPCCKSWEGHTVCLRSITGVRAVCGHLWVRVCGRG